MNSVFVLKIPRTNMSLRPRFFKVKKLPLTWDQSMLNKTSPEQYGWLEVKHTKNSGLNYLKISDSEVEKDNEDGGTTSTSKCRNSVSIPMAVIPHLFETVDELVKKGDKWMQKLIDCSSDMDALQAVCFKERFGNTKKLFDDITLRLVKFDVPNAATVSVCLTLIQTDDEGYPLNKPQLDLCIYKFAGATEFQQELHFQGSQAFDLILDLLYKKKSMLESSDAQVEVKINTGVNVKENHAQESSINIPSASFNLPNYEPSVNQTSKKRKNQYGAGITTSEINNEDESDDDDEDTRAIFPNFSMQSSKQKKLKMSSKNV